MNADQLWETTLDADARTLLQVRVNHADDADGHAEGREKTGQRRALRRPPAAREQSQQHHQRQHRHERGEERGTERIVDMIPDHRRLLGAQKATSIAARPAIPTTTSPAPSQRAIGGRSE